MWLTIGVVALIIWLLVWFFQSVVFTLHDPKNWYWYIWYPALWPLYWLVTYYEQLRDWWIYEARTGRSNPPD